MATYVLYGYSADVLVYNATTGAFDLDPSFDPATDRIVVTITDDDADFDGDIDDSGVAVDTGQTGTITQPDGTPIAAGQIYDDAFAEIDVGGAVEYLERVEIGGTHFGYLTTAVLTPGQSYDVTATNDVGSDVGGADNRLTFNDFATVPCFGPGAMILTDEGENPVEWLRPGDLVVTRDGGLKPIRWIERTRVSATELRTASELHPVHIAANAFGADGPDHPLLLSPDHRVLLATPQAELLFGEPEVLASIRYLTGTHGIDRDTSTSATEGVVYTHVMLDDHQILSANGLWVESFFPGPQAMSRISPAARNGLRRVLGTAADRSRTARLCLNRHEAALLRSLTKPQAQSPEQPMRKNRVA